MPALAKSIQTTPPRTRRPGESKASLLRRIMIWATRTARSIDGASRRPLERPFPFFGD